MTDPCRIILDVDTGIDDAMAILYALGRPGIALEACTTIYGNTELENATRNTLQILELAGRGDVPVAPGAARPLMKPYVKSAGHIHGEDGLGGIVLDPPKARPLPEHAADLMIRMIRASPGEITLLPVGPITNVAIALTKDPEIARLVRRIVIMGSTIFHPGIPSIPSPMADANFYNDPEAARIVLNCGAPITLVGMDVTMKTMLAEPVMQRIAAAGGRPAKVMMDITRFYLDAYRDQYTTIPGCGMHDPLAVAVAEDPTLVTVEPMQVDIELYGELTRGQVVADRRRTGRTRPNADVCIDVDSARFIDRFVAALVGLQGAGGA